MRGRSGFTLMEVLIVIAIISLLLMLMLPTFAKTKNAARDIMCQNNIKQMGSAMFSHAVSNNNWFVHGSASHPDLTGTMDAWTIWHAGSGPANTNRWVGVGQLHQMGYPWHAKDDLRHHIVAYHS